MGIGGGDMNAEQWAANTEHNEVIECMDESEGTISELIAAYLSLKKNDDIPAEQRPLHFWNEFELMLEGAQDLYNEQVAENNECPTCNDNGMYCSICGGSGKRHMHPVAAGISKAMSEQRKAA